MATDLGQFLGGGGGGAYIGRTIPFLSSTTYTAPSNIKGAYVLVIGGGGAGGCAFRVSSGFPKAAGGGAGGVAASYFDLTASQSYTVTVGGGGAPFGRTTQGASTGASGGSSSFSGSGITTVSATGGGGGTAIISGSVTGGAGGAGSGGNLFNYTSGAGGGNVFTGTSSNGSFSGAGGGACNIFGIAASTLVGGVITNSSGSGMSGLGAHPCGTSIQNDPLGVGSTNTIHDTTNFRAALNRYNQIRAAKNTDVFGALWAEVPRPDIPQRLIGSTDRNNVNSHYGAYDGRVITYSSPTGTSIPLGNKGVNQSFTILADPFCGSRGIGISNAYPYVDSYAGIGGGGGGAGGTINSLSNNLTLQSSGGGNGLVYLVEVLSA